MRHFVLSLSASARTLRRDLSKPMERMTTSICSWNIRRKWRSPNWSIVSRAYPLAVSGSYILRSLSGTTRVSYGHQATLLPHAVGHHYLSFASTLKIKEKTCERCALSALYLRPQTAELYGTFGKQDREQEACHISWYLPPLCPVELGFPLPLRSSFAGETVSLILRGRLSC